MQDFLKEWGPAIITAVVILILVGIVRFIAPSIKSGMSGTVTGFTDKANLSDQDINNIMNNGN